MEPITHFLTGAALSRAGCNRKTALATVTMTLAAEAADLDILAYFQGSAKGFIEHRGITHTFWAVPVLAALVVGIVWLVDAIWQSLRPRRVSDTDISYIRPQVANVGNAADSGSAKLPRRWSWLYLFACLAALSHLMLDFTNNYGLRPFYPLSRQWHAWDIVFIFDPLIFAVLLASLLLPGLFALVDREIGARDHAPRGRAASITALLFIVALWGVRDVEHRRAVAALKTMELHGEPSLRVAAFPYMLNPFEWAGVAETPDAYLSMRVDSLNLQVEAPAGIYYKPQPTPATEAARETDLGHAYLEWARFPMVEDERLDPGQDSPWRPAASGSPAQMLEHPAHLVHFLDVRFLYPDSRRRPLAAFVLLDSDLQPMEEGFESTHRQH